MVATVFYLYFLLAVVNCHLTSDGNRNNYSISRHIEITKFDDVIYRFDLLLDKNNGKTTIADIGLSTFFNPYQFMAKFEQVFRDNSAVCSFSSFHEAFTHSTDFLKNLRPDLDWSTQLSAIKLFNFQYLQNEIHNDHFRQLNQISDFRWYPISIALIVDVSFILFDNPSQNDHLTEFDQFLSSIVEEMTDLVLWANVKLYLGYYSGYTDLHDNYWYTKQCNTLMQMTLGSLPNVKCECIQIDMSDKLLPVKHFDSTVSQTISNDGTQYLNEDNINNSGNNVFDIRELIAREAYKRDNMEYYILVNTALVASFRVSSVAPWIFPAVLSLIGYDAAVGGHVGVRFVQSERAENLFAQPILHKVHFELFLGNNHVFHVQYSEKLNDILLFDLYSIIDSAQYHKTATLPISLGAIISLGTMNHLTLQNYVDKVYFLRRSLLMSLNSHLYNNNHIQWSPSEVIYQRGDLLFDLYCAETLGCQASSPPAQPVLYHHSHPSNARIAFISANYGNYEPFLQNVVRQTIPADFICFTDNPELEHHTHHNEWIIDTHPYHLEALRWEIENNATHYVNSLHNNSHPFNIAKYYKLNFHNISRLAQYDIVVWMDGNIELHNENTAEIVYDLVMQKNKNILAAEDDMPHKSVWNEVKLARTHFKYVDSIWNNHVNPFQDISAQYNHYIAQGYNDADYWSKIEPNNPNYGFWITLFVAFNMRNENTTTFLNMWSKQNREFTTEDQVSFPYVAQMLKMHPYTLIPNSEAGVSGRFFSNSLFVKHCHGHDGTALCSF